MCNCQNYGPFLGTLNIRCRTIIGIQKGTIILTITHMCIYAYVEQVGCCTLGAGFYPCRQRILQVTYLSVCVDL